MRFIVEAVYVPKILTETHSTIAIMQETFILTFHLPAEVQVAFGCMVFPFLVISVAFDITIICLV